MASTMHDARVVAYSANPWDDRLTLMIECTDCNSQWGWTPDANGAAARLEAGAEDHRRRYPGTTDRRERQ